MQAGNNKEFYLDFWYGIGGFQPRYLSANKRYRFKIIVGSENAQYVNQRYELFWTGVWKDIPEEMFKEIVIKVI